MSEPSTPNYRGFFQVNLGHVLNLITLCCGLAFMYGQVADKLDNLQTEVVALQTSDSRHEQAEGTEEITQATQGRDLADLHKAMEDDFSRRLSKLEDEVDDQRRGVK